VPTVDVHQHLWPEVFISALAARMERPRLRGSRLELRDGDFEIDLGEHDLVRRLAALDVDGTDVAIVSLQPSCGIDRLPPDEARALGDCWESGIVELASGAGGRLVPLGVGRSPDGFAGATVPARALRDMEALAPLLGALQADGGFLFVHPGSVEPDAHAPSWWAAVNDYTAQMQAAYLSWLADGQSRWPSVRVLFAFLAGGGPFQLERLASRGIEVRSALHPNVFFETSSYGRRAIELCIETFGVQQVVFGTDRPVVDPAATVHAVRSFGESVEHIVRDEVPAGLLERP
jgi:hypothetical protein